MIVDAHVHLSLYHRNAESVSEGNDVLASEMDRCGVDQAIVIPDYVDDQPDIAGLETALRLVG